MPDKAKLAKIHIAKKELAIGDDAYRDILLLNFNVESAKDLSDRQAYELINLFKAKGWKPKQRQRKNQQKYIEIKAGPSARQQRKVLALWNALGYGMGKLHTRVKKQFGVDRIEWLTDVEALHVLITDLEHRLETGRKKR